MAGIIDRYCLQATRMYRLATLRPAVETSTCSAEPSHGASRSTLLLASSVHERHCQRACADTSTPTAIRPRHRRSRRQRRRAPQLSIDSSSRSPFSSRMANAVERQGRQDAGHQRHQRRRQHPDGVRRGQSPSEMPAARNIVSHAVPKAADTTRRHTPGAASAAARRRLSRRRKPSRARSPACRSTVLSRRACPAGTPRGPPTRPRGIRSAPAGRAREHGAAPAIPSGPRRRG